MGRDGFVKGIFAEPPGGQRLIPHHTALVELYMSLPNYPHPYICARDFRELCADIQLRIETVAAIIELYAEQYHGTNTFFVPHLREIISHLQRVNQRESVLKRC